jgi:hypothetical protein
MSSVLRLQQLLSSSSCHGETESDTGHVAWQHENDWFTEGNGSMITNQLLCCAPAARRRPEESNRQETGRGPGEWFQSSSSREPMFRPSPRPLFQWVSSPSVPFRAAAACLPGHSTSDLSPFLLGGGEEEEHAHGPLILSYDDPTD